jgi:hypothetical protein
VSNEAEVLDLVSSLHINRNTASAHHRGQAFSSLARRSRIVGQLAQLHGSTENDKLRKIYASASQASAQIIQRFANRRGLCERVTRMGGRHNTSVAPCRTYISLPLNKLNCRSVGLDERLLPRVASLDIAKPSWAILGSNQ